MNSTSHTEQHSLPESTFQAPQIEALAWEGALSAPEIQVFQRRESSDYPSYSSDAAFSSAVEASTEDMPAYDDSRAAHDSYEDDDSALALHLDEGSMGDDLLGDGVSELCTSFVEDVFEPPHSTLLGRIVFGTVATVCLVALLAMALFHIWAQGQATRLGFQYSQISKQQTRLKEERRLLKLQLAKLRNPMRLARIARQQLGMRLPDRAQIISEEQVKTQLRLQREISQIRKGPRLASGRRTHLIR